MERVGYFFRYQHFNAGGGGIIGSQNLLTLLECHSWFYFAELKFQSPCRIILLSMSTIMVL